MYKLILKIVFYLAHGLRYRAYRKKFNLPKDFRFNGKDIIFYGEGSILIGENSYIGSYSTIQSSKDCMVRIGIGCSISHNVRMYTSSKNPDSDFSDLNNISITKGDITIGNFVWIGANVFINPDVNIGDNSVIGANAVVTRDIPANSVCGGVPAKVIRMKNNSPL